MQGKMECKAPSSGQRKIADAEEEDLKRPKLLVRYVFTRKHF